MRYGSIFTGIGGFDVAFDELGMDCLWQCESDKYCREILARNWPTIHCYLNVQELLTAPSVAPIDLLCGADPCPCRSRARGDRPTRHPDLAGYFLAVAGRLRPRWVVRENVFASDAKDFAAGLAALGYGIVTFGLDARDFTAQSRRRQFIVGCPPRRRTKFARTVSDACDGEEFATSRSNETTLIAACLTAHPSRMAAEDSYVFEPGCGLRMLDAEECELLQGFPRGWTIGQSRSRRRIQLGNAMNVAVATWIGQRILQAS